MRLRALLGGRFCRRDGDALHTVEGARGVAPPLGGRGGGGPGDGHRAPPPVRAAGLGVGRGGGAVHAARPRGVVPGILLRGVPARPQPHLRQPRRAVGAAAPARRGGGRRAWPGIPPRAHYQDHLQAHPRRLGWRGSPGPWACVLGRGGPLR